MLKPLPIGLSKQACLTHHLGPLPGKLIAVTVPASATFLEPLPSLSVRVPATIANVGPGFDSLGVALGLWLEVDAVLGLEDRFAYSGEGFIADSPDNFIHEGFRAACAAMNVPAPTVAFTVRNPIPLARGLGSSSAALVAGAALADAIFHDRLGRDGVLRVCADLEGHPDNVAPAVLGGFTASAMGEGGPVSVTLPWPENWAILVAIPEFELKTSEARGALPSQYSRADAVYNLSRSALWVAGVATRNPNVLREACLDRIHQPYRAPLVPGLELALRASLEAGASAAFLSGAGPSVGAVVATGHSAGHSAAGDWSNRTSQTDSTEYIKAVSDILHAYSPRVLHLTGANGYEIVPATESNPSEVNHLGR
jgi:homoserine kinase